MINVFIADDHQMFRQGLADMLKKTDDINIIGEAGDGQTTIKRIEKLKPDILILDVDMPGLTGIEVTKRATKQLPDIKVLILTMYADMFYSMEALKAGAAGYLLKEDSFSQLVSAIRTVHAGKYLVSSTIETSVMKNLVKAAQHHSEKDENILTEREREILQLITEGMTNQNIADALCISIGTVDTHRKNLMAKLDIHSVAGLVKYAIKHKIVPV